MPIHVLPEDVAAKIAAGEVIERPASVVKELIENAIDAGATEIKVEIRDGGKRLIRVVDNGCGIPADEVALAFERHATSKLQRAEDLFAIRTLGFRGEALPSIAAVSKVTIVTRTAQAPMGVLMRLEGGRPTHREGHGAPRGTVITVEHLFYNTPARLKFLKSTATETAHITSLVTRFAMAFPTLRFSLINDGRLTFQSPGNGQLLDVLVKVYGLDVARQLIPIESVDPAGEASDARAEAPVRVSGYVSPPAVHRRTRRDITLFVNRRWVQDRALVVAITEAYHTLLPAKRYPLAVVAVELDPAAVDVNVHPTKAEVRFRDPNRVFAAVQRAVRRAVLEGAPVPRVSRLASPADLSGWQHGVHPSRLARPATTQFAMELQRTGDRQLALTAGERPSEKGLQLETPEGQHPLPMLRVVGQVNQAYIVAEGPEGLYLIDQHAAHERILYERLMADRATEVASQALLEPVVVELTPEQRATLDAYSDLLQELGFAIEAFGREAVLLRAVPAILGHVDPGQALQAVLDEAEATGAPLAEEREARIIASVCKQGAIKAGQTLSLAEMQALIEQLEATSAPRTCPHGRPTMIHLSVAQLEREFGRR